MDFVEVVAVENVPLADDHRLRALGDRQRGAVVRTAQELDKVNPQETPFATAYPRKRYESWPVIAHPRERLWSKSSLVTRT